MATGKIVKGAPMSSESLLRKLEAAYSKKVTELDEAKLQIVELKKQVKELQNAN